MKPIVLIVDDQADIRKLIRLTIASLELDLHEAHNGDQAWQMAQTLRPALILLDVMMPGNLNGFEVCAKVKQSTDLGPQTKVIILSALAQSDDLAQGYAAGCDAYLVKPFSPRELLRNIHCLMENQG